MCGIIGYSGTQNAVEILVDGLSALEYRGYDSAGIAVFRGEDIEVVKSVGKLNNMKEKIREKGEEFHSFCGIGHTRWATHGKPSDLNSHPHCTENLSLVHNGIIENYLELKEILSSRLGYTFESETDTEIAAKLIDSFYRYGRDPFEAIAKSLGLIRGSYAFGVIFKDFPGQVFATRKGSPLICAKDESGSFIASDIPAVLHRTNRYYTLEEGEIAVLDDKSISFFDLDHHPIEKEELQADWDLEAAEKGNFPHFMLKEIMEQPEVIRKTVSPRIKDGLPDLGIPALTDEILKGFKRIHFVACGTAMHAGMVGKTVIERLVRVPVNVEIASEFRYNDPILSPEDLVIIISQSGETADTLAALRLAKEKGSKTLAIVNVVGSSIAREADFVLYTWAGPEIAVASTKAYTVQISACYLLTLKLALIHQTMPIEKIRSLTAELLEEMPRRVESVVSRQAEMRDLAAAFTKIHDLFFIGRGIDYSLSMEGSLKLKEISYVHSEAYAAGELKHGTISLITEGVPVVAVATFENCYEKMISNVKEVRARGARVILICREGAPGAEDVSEFPLYLPPCSEMFMPMLAVPVMQIFAYYMSVLRGCDVDKPRNLAKSVTVE